MASTHLSRHHQTSKQVSWSAAAAFVGVVYFVVTIVALHVLRPDHNPIRQPTSAYAVGPYGWLMTSAFSSLSFASLVLARGLSQGVSRRARSRIGLGLLIVWAVGLVIAMIFPIDLEGAPPTLAGRIHRVNGPLAFLSLTAGVLLISRRFKHDETWRPFHRTALILSLVMLALFLATILNIATQSGFVGLSQRVYLSLFVTWFLLTTSRLRSVAFGSVPA